MLWKLNKLISKYYNQLIIMFQKAIKKPIIISTTRFTEKTFNENIQWKKDKNWVGCSYGITKELSTDSIPYGSYTFVIEMVNDIPNPSLGKNSKNKLKFGIIGGIGLIQNRMRSEDRSRIYNDQNYNRFVFKSKYHVGRDFLIKHHKDTIELLEKILFTGSKHMKRGDGITVLSYEKIATFDPTPIPQLCSICGLLKKGHKCPGKRVSTDYTLICKRCGQKKKQNGGYGHECPALKKNKKNLFLILNLFKNLFN